tara:strand:- start:53 stop:280 length:228 start_codon:yes stop_codon:yes gene_type:complete
LDIKSDFKEGGVVSGLLCCPFCGCAMKITTVGRDWFRVEPKVWHTDDCPIDDKSFDYSQSNSIGDVIDVWNMRVT